MIIRYGMNNKLNRQGDHRTNIYYYYRVVVGYFEKGNKTTMRGRNDFPVYDGDIRWLCDVANIRMIPAGFLVRVIAIWSCFPTPAGRVWI